jgi:glycosyltransferase involved in cell wall biosynthesis
MMAAKPIIHSVNAANDFVADSGCGISVAPNSPSLVEGAISTLIKISDEELREMGVRGREFVLKHHNYKALAKKFVDFAGQIVV